MSSSSYNSASQYAASASESLYSDAGIKVTPSWLSVDQSRYAIRTIVRLDYETHRQQVGIAYGFFFGSIALMAYSLYHFTTPALPALVPWIMLIASLAICVISGAIAFGAKTSYRIVVTLLDGSKIPINTGTAKQAEGLLDSLTRAMDWHRSDDVVLEAQRTSHVRQHYATSATDPEEADAALASDVAASSSSDKRKHPSKVVRRLPPVIAGLLKGKD